MQQPLLLVLINIHQSLAREVAGAEGFEPPNGGIKTRCLTTWRRPNYRSVTRDNNGERFSPRTTYPLQRAGKRARTARAACSSGRATNTQAPVPVSLASPN